MTSRIYVRTPETRAKISAAKKGRPLSAEHRRKIGEANKGRVRSPETRLKLREANLGKAMTPETRAKIGAALKGREVSAECRANLSKALKGRLITDDHRRKISETKKGTFCGPDHPRWRGGTSFGPYCFRFNSEFKERVREFFGRRCAECGAPEGDRRHFVHHVNYRKDSCCAEDAPPLFVPLCHSCHPKTNHDREYWEARFTALINEQYGGRCYLPRAVIVDYQINKAKL